MPQEHREIMHSLGMIESKVDTLVTSSVDHERRLRGLERIRNYIAGIGTVLVVIAGWFFKGSST